MPALLAGAHRLDEHARQVLALALETLGQAVARRHVGGHVGQHAFQILVGHLVGHQRRGARGGHARVQDGGELGAHDGKVLLLGLRLRDVHGQQVFALAHGDHALDDTALLARAFHGLDLVERLDHAVDLLAGGRYPGVSEGWHQRTLFLT